MRTARLSAEFPQTSATCLDAFLAYLCDLSFPQCVVDPSGSTDIMEQPLCYSYCMSAELACGADAKLANTVCQKAVDAGRVSPDRPDVVCKSCGTAARASAVALALALLLFVC